MDVCVSSSAPPGRRGRGGLSVAVGAGPDQLVAVLAFDLGERCVDRSWEAWIVQLDREMVAVALAEAPFTASMAVTRIGDGRTAPEEAAKQQGWQVADFLVEENLRPRPS